MRTNLVVLIVLLAGIAVFVRQSAPHDVVKPDLSTPVPRSAWATAPAAPSEAAPTPAAAAANSPLQPQGGSWATPVLTQVVHTRFATTRGVLLLDVYPQAAPHAAERFLTLVKAHYYDGTPVFRVIPGFVCQFGINSQMRAWKERSFKDDPAMFRCTQGTVAFAKAGPDTNDTQIFINYADNSQLGPNGGFTPFGRVVQGMKLAEKFRSAGDPSMGLDQDALWNDTAGYLKTLDPVQGRPDMIIKAEVDEGVRR